MSNHQLEPSDVVEFLSQFRRLTADEQEAYLRFTRISQLQAPAGKLFCSKLECPVVTPCGLSSCRLHRDNPAMLNCGLYYRGTMETSTGKRRPLQEIAKTFGIDDKAARDELTDALTGVRQSSLLDALDTEHVNRFALIPGSHVCVVCGNVTDTPYKVIGKKAKFQYCSKSCLREKPVSILAIEYKYKADVRNVLKTARSLFKTVVAVSAVLNIPRPLLVRYYEYYLGVRAVEFGADVVDIVDLLRKRVPTESIDEFIVIPADSLAACPQWTSLENRARELARGL